MKNKIRLVVSFLLVSAFVSNSCYITVCSAESQLETEAESELDEGQERIEAAETESTEDTEILEADEEAAEVTLSDESSPLSEGEASISLQSNDYGGIAEDDSGNFANLVVFVDFADTDHDEHSGSLWGECFQKNPNLTELFQGDDAHPRAMKQYLKNISYGAFEPANIFPQYDSAADKIYPYKLKYNADYYADDAANGDTHIIKEVLEILASSNQIPSNINLDRNNDGCVDNLMIIVPCETGYKNEKFYGHKATYAGNETVNAKQIANYTLLPEGGVYTGASQSGVMIHEFLHTLGCPDLYIVNGGANGCVPVGYWDIMATTSMYLQYPLAYFRAEYLNWFSIPTVTSSKEGYSLYSASDATEETKNNQAVILKTDYSSSEFFVLEFRKQGVPDSADSTKQDYDCKIPGSGLVIYRVNMGVQEGNAYAPPYMVYIFGENDTYDENGFEKADYGRIQTSFLSAESKRTSFGNSDLNASLSDNALTYSDGTNSGIVISNVGSAKGEQITFDITFSQEDEESRWRMESEDTMGLSMSVLDSCRDENGEMYCLVQTDYASGSSALLNYSNGKWSRTADGPKGRGHRIALYNGKLYVAYLDTSFHVRLAGWDGKSWNDLFTSAAFANEVRAEGSSDGIYLAYANQNGDTVYAYKYSDVSGIKQLGDKAASSSGYAVNVEISSANGNVFVAYREWNNNNYLYVKQYSEKTNSWNSIMDGTMQGNTVFIKQKGALLYLLKNGTTSGKNGSYLYVYDVKTPDSGWIQMGSNMVTDTNVIEADICFNGSAPYIAYNSGAGKTCVMEYKDGQWSQLGTNISNQNLSGMKLYYDAGRLYTAYLDSVTGRITVRYFAVDEQQDVEIDSVVLNKESCTLGVGESVTLIATISPGNTTEPKTLIWESSDSSVAIVDAEGKITGKKEGYAVITVKAGNGKSASCTVEITHSNWQKDSKGYKYKDSNGSYVCSQWKQIEDAWYYFDSSGYRVTGWRQMGGTWYYFGSDGKMVTGWQTIGSQRYYFYPTGGMVTGWKTMEGKTYYFYPSGSVAVGRLTISGTTYEFDEDGGLTATRTEGWNEEKGTYYYYKNGKAVTGWQYLGAQWYYFGSDGKMVTGWQTIGSQRYYFYPTGGMVTGWKTMEGKTYYFYPSGSMATGKLTIGGTTYEFDEDGGLTATRTEGWNEEKGTYYYYKNGKAVTGWQYLGAQWYYFGSDGKMVTGWQTIGSQRYYFYPTGGMVTGWKTMEGKTYYFYPSGSMAAGRLTISGTTYEFDEDGVLTATRTEGWNEEKGTYYYYKNGKAVTGWQYLGAQWYYFGSDGKMVTGWQTIGSQRYYFYPTGGMVTGWKTMEGKTYYFYPSGSAAVGKLTIGGVVFEFDKDGVLI